MSAAAKRKPKPVPPCKVDGCTSLRTYTRGLCALHWCTRADLADPVPPVKRTRLVPEPLASAVVSGRGASPAGSARPPVSRR